MKRTLDLLLVLLFAVVFTIPMLFVSIMQICLLGWPVLFHQKRIGHKGRSFYIHKFRTMKLGDGSDQERMTHWGKFLRSTSLDELPELWNVLIGEMSFVGPRPLPASYKDRYTPEQNRRHQVLPGITGWAQVNGRNNITWDKQFELDCWYIDNRSIMLDLKILFLTILTVIQRKNINETNQSTRSEFLGNE